MVPLPRLINTVVPIIIQNVARERSLCHRIPKNKDANIHSCCSLKQLSARLQIPYSKNLASPFPLIIISCQVSKLQWNEAKKCFENLLIEALRQTWPETWCKCLKHLHFLLQLRYGGPHRWCQTLPDQRCCETLWRFWHGPNWQRQAGVSQRSSLLGRRSESAMM